jgi:hypothetical protein
MMFNGSKNVGPEQHAQLINARGGEINAYTTNDFTVYFDDVTTESLPLVIDLEHERVKNLDISETTLTKERQVVLEERRLRTEDSPMGRAYEALLSLVWQAHPYRWPVIGWRSDIEKATVEACREFFSSYYVPDNITIAIVGAFDAEEALAQLRRTFGTLEPAGTIPRNPTEEPPQDGERTIMVRKPAQLPSVMLGYQAVGATHPDRPALDVAARLLAGGESARLTLDMVRTTEVATGVYADLNWGIAPELFAIYAQAKPGKTADDLIARVDDGIAALGRALPKIMHDPSDRSARSDALYGAWLCGCCLGAVGMALHHKLCHTLGGTFDLPHAETHTVVLPHAIAYNAAAAPQAMARIARALGTADAATGAYDLAGRLGAGRALRDLGMPEGGIELAADLASQSPYPNPRPIERAAIRDLIARAWAGAPPQA